MQNVGPFQPITPTIIEVIKEPANSIDMIQVAVAAFGLTGVIMGAAVVAGLSAGVCRLGGSGWSFGTTDEGCGAIGSRSS